MNLGFNSTGTKGAHGSYALKTNWFNFAPIDLATDKRSRDPEIFFKALETAFSDATQMYVEGSSFSPAVETLLKEYSEEGPFLPGSQTLGAKQFRCTYCEHLTDRLTRLSQAIPAPEICDHIYLYKHHKPYLMWADAFLDFESLYVCRDITQEALDSFVTALALRSRSVIIHSYTPFS